MKTTQIQIRLTRKDPRCNMARYYVLTVEPDLFGQILVGRAWGRIGSNGQTITQSFESAADAHRTFDGLLKARRKRGYRPDKQKAPALDP